MADVRRRRRRRGCARRPWRRTAWSGESGLRTVIGAPPAGVLAGGRLVRARSRRSASRWRGDTSAWLTTSVSAGPDERVPDRLAELERARAATAAARRVGQGRRDLLEAVDAGDLLDDVRLDGEVAPPRRDRRDQRRSVGSAATLDRLGPPATTTGIPAPSAGRVATPARARTAACCRRPPGPARGAGRPGPAGRRPRARRARRARCRPGPRSASRRPSRATSRAQRSAPIRARRTSWPFSNRRLASERSP